MAASSSASAKKKTTKRSTSGQTAGKSTARQTTKRASGSTQRKRKSVQQARQDEMRDNILALVLIAVTIILMLSNFNLAGSVGGRIKWFFFGLMGIVAYIFPIVMLGITFYLISNRNQIAIARIKSCATIVLLCMCSALWQRISNRPSIQESSLGAFFSYSAMHKSGGGFFGGLVCILFRPLGLWGSMVLILLIGIIACLFISEKSFIGGMLRVRRQGTRMVRAAKQDYDIYREHSANRPRKERKEVSEEEYLAKRRQKTEDRIAKKAQQAEEKKLARMEKKALGVTKDTKLVEKEEPQFGMDLQELLAQKNNINDIYSDDIYDLEDIYEKQDNEPEELPFVQEEGVYGEMAGDALVHQVAQRLNEAAMHTDNPLWSDVNVQSQAEIPESVQENIVEPQMNNPLWDNIQVHSEEEQPAQTADYEEVSEYEGFPSEIQQTVESHGTPFAQKMQDEEVTRQTMQEELANRQVQTNSSVQETSAEEESSDAVTVQEEVPLKKEYKFPPLSLLTKGKGSNGADQMMERKQTAMRLQQTLQTFGVNVTITDISCGPSVTRYELQPEMGVKVSKIVSLSDDIKLNLAAADIRIEAPIPGKAAIGIEVPNKEPGSVMLRDLLESESFQNNPSPIAFGAGKDIAGKTIVADIQKMPHLLIAGATGSGKSVCINTIIMSILYKANPEDVKMIMVDPKVVELSVYNGIPHLMIPVVTDCKKAAGALNWAVAEMDKRYKLFAQMQAKNLKDYNAKIERMETPEGEEPKKKIPQLVIIIDELADLMMVAPGDVESAICRLAQLARAAGIHLVIATQRPSVNVITGLIKANVPSRIAFSVSSGVDSRTIIDMNGAEKLLGKGDMLFYPSGYPKPVRVQGAFVSDEEVGRVVDFLKEQVQNEDGAQEQISEEITSVQSIMHRETENERDPYFAEAARFVIGKEKGSIGMLQRYYKIGFNRAGRIMDQLADAGVVGPEVGTKPRKVLMTLDEFEEYLKNNG